MQRSKKESGAFIRNKYNSLCRKQMAVTTLPVSPRKKRRTLPTDNHNIHDRIIAQYLFFETPREFLVALLNQEGTHIQDYDDFAVDDCVGCAGK